MTTGPGYGARLAARALALSLAVLALAAGRAAAAAPSKEPVLVGIAFDGTSAIGRTERDAAVLAIDEWNASGKGRPIKYVLRDNGGDPAKATTIAKEFVSMKIAAAIGGSHSVVGIPESKVFTAERIPFISGAASRAQYENGPDGKWYVFSTAGAVPVMAEMALPDAAKKGHKRIAFFITNVAFGKDIVNQMKELIATKYGPKYGMQVVGDFAVDSKATDVTAEVMKLRETKPDAVMALLFADNVKAYFRAAAETGWLPVAPSYNFWAMMEPGYNASEKTMFWGARAMCLNIESRPDVVARRQAFQRKFGYEPNTALSIVDDSVQLLLRAIDAVGPNGPAIRDWLEAKAKGQPITSGSRSARADFSVETMHSLMRSEDYAFASIGKDGQRIWE